MTQAGRSFAIIPACGESRRMGTDKLLLPWNDSTILETVIAAWQKSTVDHIFVVIPQERTDLPKLLQTLPVHVVTADPRPRDMKESIQHGLRAIQSRLAPTPSDVWLVAPADMPTLSTQTIDLVLKAARKNPGRIIRPMNREKHGHPALFPWAMADEVFQLSENEGLNILPEQFPPVDVVVEEIGEDVDTKEELTALQRKENLKSPRSFFGRIDLIQKEYDRGRSLAEEDVANGERKIYVQTRGAGDEFLSDLMRQRYGILVEYTSDITWNEKRSFEDGYNSVAREYIESVDGKGAIRRVLAEVKTFRDDQYRQYLENNGESDRPELDQDLRDSSQ
ncbi:nucleotidyltransferase family protein [Bremerella sp. P1]|uniref:nucleotidyltransferase family protein n=1 Tax=Bremerella sp. P1 TaxID=3026424 RepID=UPI00236826DB|nr:nucleotidyltransferase family protein [Bremerella sp. P1]WDI42773.1 nucleotidyltransferase family protein [Bremerella sp. P1]